MSGRSWTRRQLLQTGALSALAASAGPLVSKVISAEEPRTVYVAGAESRGGAQGVHVYAVQDGIWTRVQFVPVAEPSALAPSPAGDRLFVAKSAHRGGRPAGSAEAYAVEDGSGRLRWIGTGDLALGAVRPGRLAVSPDGSLLAFAAEGGHVGVQPILGGGIPGPVTAMHKDLREAWQTPPRLLFTNAEHLIAWNDSGAAMLYRHRAADGALTVLGREQSLIPPADPDTKLLQTLAKRFPAARFHAVAAQRAI